MRSAPRGSCVARKKGLQCAGCGSGAVGAVQPAGGSCWESRPCLGPLAVAVLLDPGAQARPIAALEGVLTPHSAGAEQPKGQASGAVKLREFEREQTVIAARSATQVAVLAEGALPPSGSGLRASCSQRQAQLLCQRGDNQEPVFFHGETMTRRPATQDCFKTRQPDEGMRWLLA